LAKKMVDRNATNTTTSLVGVEIRYGFRSMICLLKILYYRLDTLK
jgi:hypothetical protein